MKLIKSFLLVFVLVPSTLLGELVCPRSDGCPIDDKTGTCIGCIQEEKKETTQKKEPQKLPLKPKEKEKKKNWDKKESFEGFIQEGQYQITKVVNNDGFSLVWERGVILDISNVSGGSNVPSVICK